MPLDANKLGFECVLANEHHASLIMEWRNDPETLKASFHTEPKVWEQFFPEFLREYFSIPELPPLFVLYEGERVAFLRFRAVVHPLEPQKRCCELSINVSSDWRRKGLAKMILAESQHWVRSRGFDAIYAEIKEENVISQKVFTSVGYEFIGKAVKHVEDTHLDYPICRYIVNLNSGGGGWRDVFVIAEAGSNWRMGTYARDKAMAFSLIDVAAEAGADAVKFQVFKSESVYVPNAGSSEYLSEAGITEDISSIFKDLAMPYEMIPELAEYCRKCGVKFMATPFSEEDFKAVDPYVDVHKIASYELSHVRLIEQAALSGKPLILSTGAANEADISWAVDTFYSFEGKHLTLLQCTAKYPADPDSMNLRVIPWLHRRYGVDTGLSDHSADAITAPVAAVALGARVIEKHYTLNKKLPGPDHAFAIDPTELKQMVRAIRDAEQMLGSGLKEVMGAEEQLRDYARRGVQAIRPIRAGEALREGENIAILRPGQQTLGVHPKHLVAIEGQTAARDILPGEGIQREHFTS